MNIYNKAQLSTFTLTQLKNMLDDKEQQKIKLTKIRSKCYNLNELRLLNVQLNNIKSFIKVACEVARSKLQFNNIN